MPDGREVYAYSLKNNGGMCVKILEYAGIINKICVPDKNGNFADVAGGYDDLASYLGAGGYQGALIGRFGNRIAKGEFTIDGREYTLFCNNGENSLHGGKEGFNTKIWQTEPFESDSSCGLVLKYTSPDGEEGYPGNLSVEVTYTLADDGALSIEYRAETDKKTVLNLTNHTYFNLSGFDAGSVREHILTLDADSYLPTDAGLIPTGEIKSVAGTPFDFRTGREIGKDIDSDCTDLKLAGGYDHCLNFTGGAQEKAVLRGRLFDPATGRVMELFTDMPCVQLYTGNFLGDSKYPFKGNKPQKKQGLLCLETQKMPDSPNKLHFSDCTLSPGEVFRSVTVYKFSAI